MKGQKSHLNDPHAERSHELDVADIRNDEVHHEEGDINVRSVYQALLWLGAGMVVVYFIVFGIIKWNESRVKSANEVVTHVAKTKAEQLPPEPRLQLAPGHAMHPLAEGAAYRDSVEHLLESFGYINQATGDIHIPIDLAKDMVVKRGFATRATNQETPALMIPEFSSSGRTETARDNRIPGGTFTVTGGNSDVREAGK
ncbi:MAG: hypothetical protein Q8922_13735 [Bacteroidota bacterium]|nr:hypothetical protein [Bacteroidota bacterium]MDP4234622.1 hypothetical protein [Bacteroidota bacterium]MDP4243779.1 hypothetical protein [Bacteroidota bacterium]MDP4288983.1 hypothetical protein [Bacteroidota bacterium]